MITFPDATRRHRAPRRPLRLTQRGRIIRDLTVGAGVLGAVVFAYPISVAYFTAALWLGNLTGLSS